ncbi:hypothetical protein CYMTET_37976, partial [Cymbomonas tetramitiformis]
VVGGLYCNSFDAALLREAYGALMLLLCIVLLTQNDETENVCEVDADSDEQLREMVSDDGVTYMYKAPQTDLFGAALTSFGALLTGILSVGIGEVVLPQLTRRWCIPVPVAAGTSVFVVITVALSSVFGQLSVFLAMDELEKMNEIPCWFGWMCIRCPVTSPTYFGISHPPYWWEAGFG